MSKDLITIAIPIYNETGAAEKVVDATVALSLNKEIIIIDDGSTLPETISILKRLKKRYPSILFLENKPNIGKAQSIKRAIQQAKGNIFVALDSDYEQDPLDIIVLYKTLQASGASMVNGYRVIKDPKARELYTSRFSGFSRWVMRLFTNILYGFSIQDVLSGYKMFYTNMFRKHDFSSKRFGLETEFIVETIRQGKRIVETEVNYYPRTYKEGKKINILDSIEILWVLFQKSTLYNRLRGFIIPTALFIFALLVYSNTLRYYPTTDALPNSLVGLNILQEGRLDLENYVPYLTEKDLIGITTPNSEGIHYPKTSYIYGLFSAPIIAAINAWYGVGKLSPGADFPLHYIYSTGKIVAIVYAALSAAILYVLIRRLHFSRIISLVSTLIYIMATGVFNTAAQANWTHAITLFCVNIFLLAVLTMKQTKYPLILLGLAAGFLTSMRFSNGFYALIPLVYIYLSYPSKSDALRSIMYYICAVIAGYGLMLALALLMHIPGGYSDEIMFSLKIWSVPLFVQNFFALFFSYNFGLFAAFPILLFAVLPIRSFYHKRQAFELALLSTLMMFIGFAASWWMWSGGYSNSARLLTDLTPIFIIYLASSLKLFKHNRNYQILFVAALLASISTNIISVYMADTSWHDKYTKPGHENQLRNAWYSNPTYFQYHLNNQTFTFTSLYEKKGTVWQHESVIRPSLKYRGFVKIFDGQRPLIKYEK